MDFAGDHFVEASAEILRGLFKRGANFAENEVKASYQLFEVADGLVYTALTITIPVRPIISSNETLSLTIDHSCSSEGCLLQDEAGVFGEVVPSITPDVRVNALCNSTNGGIQNVDKSACALVLVSVGKRTTGQAFDLSTPSIIASELRTTFTLTIGMLNWTLEDLGALYNAECDIPVASYDISGCKGIHVVTSALKKSKKVVLVGVHELQMGELYDISTLKSLDFFNYKLGAELFDWKQLVGVDKSPAILFPRNFANVDTAVRPYFEQLSSECALSVDQLIRRVETNHLYAEESLQMSYTAALHYLLQNGVLHTTSLRSGERIIDFIGNYQAIHVQMSIPLTNIVISSVGCGILVVIGAAVVAKHRRGKSIIEANSSVSVIAEAVLNSNKYPRSVLTLALDQTTPGEAEPRRINLDHVQFGSAVFIEKPAKPLKAVAPKPDVGDGSKKEEYT